MHARSRTDLNVRQCSSIDNTSEIRNCERKINEYVIPYTLSDNSMCVWERQLYSFIFIIFFFLFCVCDAPTLTSLWTNSYNQKRKRLQKHIDTVCALLSIYKIIRESRHFNDNQTRTNAHTHTLLHTYIRTHAHNLLNSSAKSKKETTNTLRWSTTLDIYKYTYTYSVSRVVCIQENSFFLLATAVVVIGLCVVGVICCSWHIEIQGNGSYRTTNTSQRWVINVFEKYLNEYVHVQ